MVFRAYLASDGKTPATGQTPVITISKNGGAFGNPAAGATTATEISSGFYKFTLGAGDTDTLGPLAWRGADADINDAGDVLSVVSPYVDVGFVNGVAQSPGDLYGDLAKQSTLQAVKGSTDNIGTPANLTSGPTVAANLSDIYNSVGFAMDAIGDVGTEVNRILGLSHDNWVMDDLTFDGDDLTAATIYVYDSAANATLHDGATGLRYRWAFTATYAAGVLVESKQVRVT